MQVLDLEDNGQPDVVLDLYSGGAHCCSIEQVFSFDPGTMTYGMTQHDFGDPGEQIVDLGHNGRFEFLTADDSFAYEFTDFAASGLPIQILTFSGGRFLNVTRSYPGLIAKDAARWMKASSSMAKQHYSDSVGLAAAWAADQELLGHVKRRQPLPRPAAEGRAPEQRAQPRGARRGQVRGQAEEVPAHARLRRLTLGPGRPSARSADPTPAAASASGGFG